MYQLRLEDSFDAVKVAKESTDDFPYLYRHEKSERVLLTDTNGNAYIVNNANGLTVEKKIQSSPYDNKSKIGEGMFISAYLDHGTAPKDASYEYLMLVEATAKERSNYVKTLPYDVIQADDSAHAVRDNITGITAYISYKGYTSESSLVREMPSEVIVMERTKSDESVVMSVCTPDLGITQKGYTTSQPSQPLLKEIHLNGKWTLKSACSNVAATIIGDQTVVSATCIHGQPVEFELVADK